MFALLSPLAAGCSCANSPSRQHHHMHLFQRITSMPALRELWVEDFRHCVTQPSDVFGGDRDVPSGSTESLPQLMALSLSNTLHDISEKDAERDADKISTRFEKLALAG